MIDISHELFIRTRTLPCYVDASFLQQQQQHQQLKVEAVIHQPPQLHRPSCHTPEEPEVSSHVVQTMRKQLRAALSGNSNSRTFDHPGEYAYRSSIMHYHYLPILPRMRVSYIERIYVNCRSTTIKTHCFRCLCISKEAIPPHGILLYSSLLLHHSSCRCRLTLHKAHVLTPDFIEDLPSARSQATPRGGSSNNSNNSASASDTRSSSNTASSRLNRRASTHNIVNNSGKSLGKIL